MLSLFQPRNPSPFSAYKNKLNGWLSYAFASEVFVIVSLTLFLPICLEQFARDNGFLLPDKTERCSAVVAMATNATVVEPVRVVGTPETRCVVKIGGGYGLTVPVSVSTSTQYPSPSKL